MPDTLPPVAAEELDHVLHTMRLSGELARLDDRQLENIQYAFSVACPGRWPLRVEEVLERFPPEYLDHLVHAMHTSGRLARLSAAQVEAIAHALRSAGHSQYVSVKNCTYNQANLITFCNADALKSPLFREAYRLGKATDSWQGLEVEWRVYVLCWAAARGARLGGDFVECGVNRGGFSRAAMHYIDFNGLAGKKFYLLDTYCGFPEEHRALAASCDRDNYAECYEAVRATFAPFPGAVVVRGKVPDALAEVKAERVCYLSIDMNCAEPEIAAAEFFWDRLVSGAAVVLDDYGAGEWYLRQKQAFDDFARRRGVEVLSLPTGQGLILKP
jgi:O-methyltransferase